MYEGTVYGPGDPGDETTCSTPTPAASVKPTESASVIRSLRHALTQVRSLATRSAPAADRCDAIVAYVDHRLGWPHDTHEATIAFPLADRAEVIARVSLATQWHTLAHTARVVELLPPTASDELRAVAWLHDVLEDTELTVDDLRDLRFPDVVVEAVLLVTRPAGQPYSEYKAGLLAAPGLAGELARGAKLADATENVERADASGGVPKWHRLAETRYRPMIHDLGGNA